MTVETLRPTANGTTTEFTLSGLQSTNLNNYYDGSNWVAHRIYQQVV